MIQRIQSVYLTVVLLLSILLFSGSLLNFTDESGKALKLMISGSLNDQVGQTATQALNLWPLIVVLVLIALLSVITVFLFKIRSIQLFLSITLIALAAVLILGLSWYGYKITNSLRMTIVPGFNLAIPPLILIFSVLARRGILKDERLVKSYERLR